MTMHEASPHAQAARAEKRREAEAMGIDEAFVSALVERFYDKARVDPQIGPMFAAHVADWPAHLDQLKRFWRSILFSSGEYLGRPMPKHLAMAKLNRDHFLRWLALFEETLGELGTDAARAHVLTRARAIGNSLLNGAMIHHHGRLGLTAAEAL